jgi:integrase/recombinase XerC/integrase/recombinase XerD
LLTKSQTQFQRDLLTKFLNSRRQGLSNHTLAYYKQCLTPFVSYHEITPEGINSFLSSLKCGNGKRNYHNAITTFVLWLLKAGYLKDNPLERVEKPIRNKRLLPSLNKEQLQDLLNHLDNPRDKALISLLFDSGMRLNELSNIKQDDIEWNTHTIIIIGKGNKQRKAPFSSNGSAKLLREWLSQYSPNGCNIWGMNRWGIQTMLRKLGQVTGIKCNPHSFRRGFACNLHRRGLSTLDIMHLGGWEDLSMVMRYTKSITFDDCLKHYREIE